jgi:hypothetical protein
MFGNRLFAALGTAALISLLVANCTTEFSTTPKDGGVQTEFGTIWPDTSGGGKCRPGQDTDMDKIPDDVEGCGKDTDNDGYPDYNDTDSDNDGVPDSVEAGPNPKAPRDSDGDKIPDYKEKDSDGDGVKDGDEDRNGDGKLGCCMTRCGEQRKGCPKLEPNRCGLGQKCQGGNCVPLVHFLCSNGETDPTKKVTFPSTGKGDKDLPTFICNKGGEAGSTGGLKPMNFRTSTPGQWKVALETNSSYGAITIRNPGPKEAAAAFDLKGGNQQVAGFLVSLPISGGDIQSLVINVVDKVRALPGQAGVTQLSSGIPKTSHDKFKTVVSTQLQLRTNAPLTPAAVRNALFSAFLGKQVANLPGMFGSPTQDHRIQFQTLLRNDGRLIVMGGVASVGMVQDATKSTGIHMDDLSNGTGLATLANSGTVECDPFILTGTPVADIIWVVDESGSMNDNRNDVANNASDFFSRALKSGLDFRTAVTNVDNGTSYGYYPGKFCSRISTDRYDSGGADRFLQPGERSIFEACIRNPPGYEGGSEYSMINSREAVLKHLPRKPGDATKIRPGATLVIIVATDEFPNDIYRAGASLNYRTCTLDAANQAKVNAWAAPFIQLFTGANPAWGTQAKATMHLIGGVCNNTCDAYVAHGLNETVAATSGLKADVCQKNLGTSMQIIINQITGLASPAILQYVPISASLAVAIDKRVIPRSRVNGFDYTPSANSLVFIGVPFPKGSQVVASYRRWVQQTPVQ